MAWSRPSPWLTALEQQHPGRVIDVIGEGRCAALKQAAKELNFGLYVVRGAVEEQHLSAMEAHFSDTMRAIAQWYGNGSTRCVCIGNHKGADNQKYYSWQATSRGCTCAYKYESTRSHPVFRCGGAGGPASPIWGQPPAITQTLEHASWVLGKYGVKEQHAFNLFVANLYEGPENNLGWHDDSFHQTNYPPGAVTAENAKQQSVDILSMSLYDSGVLCYGPNKNKHNQVLWRRLGGTQKTRPTGRGALLLNRGDIMLFTGSFQEYMAHKAIPLGTLKDPDHFLQQMSRYDHTGDEALPPTVCDQVHNKRAVVTCRILRTHTGECPQVVKNNRNWADLTEQEHLDFMTPPPPPLVEAPVVTKPPVLRPTPKLLRPLPAPAAAVAKPAKAGVVTRSAFLASKASPSGLPLLLG